MREIITNSIIITTQKIILSDLFRTYDQRIQTKMGKTDKNEAVARSNRKDWNKILPSSVKLTSENLET
jgi:hypothetical protein